ncbi:MAG: response regulator [Phycisphaera sp.]|nr:response regulator [Phycisphaera sp.]
MGSGSAKVLFIDNHTLMRESMGKRLEAFPAVRALVAVGATDDAGGFVVAIEPDVILVDLDIQPTRALLTASQMLERYPDARPIFVASPRYERHLIPAIELGARGFLLKPVYTDVLADAISEVAEGGVYFSEPLRTRVQFVAGRVELVATVREDTLTDRQVEVLRMIALGLTKRQIAQDLRISEKTVEGHTDKVMAKLNIHDRVGLTRHAIRTGVIAP